MFPIIRYRAVEFEAREGIEEWLRGVYDAYILHYNNNKNLPATANKTLQQQQQQPQSKQRPNLHIDINIILPSSLYLCLLCTYTVRAIIRCYTRESHGCCSLYMYTAAWPYDSDRQSEKTTISGSSRMRWSEMKRKQNQKLKNAESGTFTHINKRRFAVRQHALSARVCLCEFKKKPAIRLCTTYYIAAFEAWHLCVYAFILNCAASQIKPIGAALCCLRSCMYEFVCVWVCFV